MTVKEYLEQLSAFEINRKKVSKIEKAYTAELPELVQKMISNCEKPVFLGEYRVLSFAEIFDAEDDLGIAFADKGIIPLVDCGDNDFIVYNFQTAKWSLFNIVDECAFKVKATIQELMK